ncbi:MAG TPA: DUF4340 domain-containing protein [Verrucomicrobiae bacterium]|nr:DUF4340 domain-containing protein [Verrucomicrobiae bacterium]
MNPKKTWFLLAVAAGLFAFIFFLQRHSKPAATGPEKLLAGFSAKNVNDIRVLPKGQLLIHAQRTNGTWRLTEPLNYPAQNERIESLLSVLEHLAPARFIPSKELKDAQSSDEQFGFDSPQFSFTVGHGQRPVRIGRKTAPGDQVFVEVVGVDGVFIVDANLLKLLPHSASDWRQRALVDWRKLAFNRVVVTNAGKTLELQFSATNKSWHMTSPMDARADGDRVGHSIEQLQKLRVNEFVSDDPKADLDSFGLRPPDLTISFYRGTNSLISIGFGKSPTNDAKLAYAKRADQDTVVTVPRDAFDPWLLSHSHDFRDFFDPHLIALTRRPDSIEVHARDNFTLRETNNVWRVLPENWLADSNLVREFIGSLTNFRVAGIAKEIVAEPDLPKYNLMPPSRQYILTATETNHSADVTNRVLAQVDFGTTTNNDVFARRPGESFVFSIKPADLQKLPSASWELRDRRIWHFTEDQVARVIIHEKGKTREIIHKGTNSWSLAPGSQGIINEFALEETAHRVGDLSAAVWTARGDKERARFGFTEKDLRITMELKDGRKFEVEFGGTAPSGFPYAITQIENEPWIFEFPWTIYQFVQLYFTIPDYIH